MKEISLQGGKVTVVDDDDFVLLSRYTWFFHAATGYAMGYVTRGRGRSPVYLHRVILNAQKGDYVDHANRDKLNNTRANIRICSQSENMFNREHTGKKSNSKRRGVSRSRYQWRARIGNRTIGYYATEDEAARAYDEAAKESAPEFVTINFKGDA